MNNIHKSFNDAEIIKGTGLSVDKGEVVTLIGRSGSGKTTLLRMTNALEIPTEGTVFVNDKIYTSKNKKSQIEVHRQSDMVSQSYNLSPYKTTLEDVVEGLITVKKLKKTGAHEKSLESLEEACLTHVKDQRPHALSGGQQQRTAIAGVLAMNPKMMLFDEPTSALDPEFVNDVLKVIKDLANEGITMITVTHEVRFARGVSNNIIFIHKGIIEEQGAPEEIFNNPRIEELKYFLNAINEE